MSSGRTTTLFFSVGEPSGDIHGANLIEELRQREPQIRCVGLGGPRMREAGCELQFELTTLAVMGLLKVLPLLYKFWTLYRETGRYFDQEKVDAVVLIDFPGFNWWVAKAARARGIPVYYYGAPQMWAWASWRIRKIKRLVDVALCKLPFEARWYQDRGMRAVYVGHPFYDEIAQQQVDENFVAELKDGPPLILLLPGSRDQEVQRNLQTLLQAAADTAESCPETRFALSCLHPRHADQCREMIRQQNLPRIEVYSGRTGDLMRVATGCVACSGSVSLELMYNVVPTVIVYRISRITLLMTKLLVKVRYITLVNLLWTSRIEKDSRQIFDPDAEGSEPVPFPEYVTTDNSGPRCARHLIRWLRHPEALENQRQKIRDLKERVAELGASGRGAEIILDLISESKGREKVTPSNTGSSNISSAA